LRLCTEAVEVSTTKNSFTRVAKPSSFGFAGYQVLRANKETWNTISAGWEMPNMKFTNRFRSFRNRANR